MKRIEAALDAWRAAERRVEEANGNRTPAMLQELAEAKQQYQELASAHVTEQLDALHDSEQRRGGAVPSSRSLREATVSEEAHAKEGSAAADDMERDARRAS
jgi:hypothetical protein